MLRLVFNVIKVVKNNSDSSISQCSTCPYREDCKNTNNTECAIRNIYW